MRLRWWKKEHECNLAEKVKLLEKELKIQEKETQPNKWMYNQEKEKNLLLDNREMYA